MKDGVSLRKEDRHRLSPGPSVLLWFDSKDEVQRLNEKLTWTVFTLD